MIYFLYPSVTSTQDIAFSYYVRFGVPKTLVVFRAFSQTQGYGRKHSVWSSPFGNIFLSILFSIPAHSCYSNTLVWMAARSVVLLLQEYGIDAYLKYPNDIFVKKKKISGILGHVFHTESLVWGCILGIGINVNTSPHLQGAYDATSFKECSGATWDLELIVQTLIKTLIDQFNMHSLN
ncbi:bifunctional protein BirA [Holospora obtusa F1]|uniref:Bifunctional protein BirA n=1 Tax=Holospora obtusa F1 TaxID=1399147 RepID=W6TGW6_HOLOB|nr:biotin--[acetyl-CoA-carboxylase] ligase [Holospora obtusa]ETZ07180.1 bifunctional protein BirA [Holospora obtusa F1]